MLILFAACIILVVLGIKWQSWDYNRIKNIDYRKNSRLIMRNDYGNPDRFLTGIKGMMLANQIYIIDEYEKDKSVREIVGQSGRFWLLANYLNKVTVLDIQSGPKNGSEVFKREFLVFDGYIHTGSRAFLSIATVVLMAIIAVSLKKEFMPHIFPKTRERHDESGHYKRNDSSLN